MNIELATEEIEERIYARLVTRLEDALRVSRSPYLTVPEAAEYLRCKRQRIHNLTSAGKLARHKDGGRTLILRADLDALIDEEPARW
jgi:excisionase family DNA binding protein